MHTNPSPDVKETTTQSGILTRIKRWLKEALFSALCLFLVVIVLDWWRLPKEKSLPNHSLETISGEMLHWQSLNTPTLVYVWGEWCGYCQLTSDSVEKLHQQGVPVISVALQSGDEASVREYMQTKQLSFPVINDPQGALARQLNISTTPTFWWVKEGKVLYASSGWSSYWGLQWRWYLINLLNT